MNIKPITDLRNYSSVLKECKVGEPIYLTKTAAAPLLSLIWKNTPKLKN